MLYIDDNPADVQLPSAVDLAITETEPGLRGNTASGGGTKPAMLETGAQINVPLFVNIGDRVRVDTRSGDYVPVPDAASALMARRTEQRRAAIWALYQSDLLERPLDETFPRDVHAFTRVLATEVKEHQPELDATDHAVRERLVAGADRAARALDPARRAARDDCAPSCFPARSRSRLRARSTRRSRPPRSSAAPMRPGSSTASLPRRCVTTRSVQSAGA